MLKGCVSFCEKLQRANLNFPRALKLRATRLNTNFLARRRPTVLIFDLIDANSNFNAKMAENPDTMEAYWVHCQRCFLFKDESNKNFYLAVIFYVF